MDEHKIVYALSSLKKESWIRNIVLFLDKGVAKQYFKAAIGLAAQARNSIIIRYTHSNAFVLVHEQ